MPKRTDKEKGILLLALAKLEEYYNEQESICRQFKSVCHKHLPQSGEGYVANKNVFDIQDKTIENLRKSKAEGHQTIMKIINES